MQQYKGVRLEHRMTNHEWVLIRNHAGKMWYLTHTLVDNGGSHNKFALET